MYEKIHANPIVNNQIRSMTLTIILWLYQRIQDAVTVLLRTLTLPGKHRSIFIMSNYRHSVILGRENVARAPNEVPAEFIQSLNQHFRLDGHVEIYRDMGAARHLKYP